MIIVDDVQINSITVSDVIDPSTLLTVTDNAVNTITQTDSALTLLTVSDVFVCQS